jgi:hypothetical protein
VGLAPGDLGGNAVGDDQRLGVPQTAEMPAEAAPTSATPFNDCRKSGVLVEDRVAGWPARLMQQAFRWVPGVT